MPDPQPGAYRPFVSARSPGGRPANAPKYRVLVHRQYLDEWNSLIDRVGLGNGSLSATRPLVKVW